MIDPNAPKHYLYQSTGQGEMGYCGKLSRFLDHTPEPWNVTCEKCRRLMPASALHRKPPESGHTNANQT